MGVDTIVGVETNVGVETIVGVDTLATETIVGDTMVGETTVEASVILVDGVIEIAFALEDKARIATLRLKKKAFILKKSGKDPKTRDKLTGTLVFKYSHTHLSDILL